MNPDGTAVVLDEQGWRSIAFLLSTGELSVSEFVDIAVEQVSL